MDEGTNEFRLCPQCRDRQGPGLGISLAKEQACFICGGLLDGLETTGAKIASGLRPYEFKTFSIGLVLPNGVQEREDTLRSELKVRGGQTIKSEVARKLAQIIAKKMRGKKQDRMEPDVTVLADLGQGGVSVSSKSLFLYARYTKPRGVAQRRLFCPDCNGRGCERCDGTGYSPSPSVEGAVSKKLESMLGSTRFKFTWFGSEDTDSIVFPPGRPMVVEAKSPLKRRAPKSLKLKSGKGSLDVSGMRAVAKDFEHPAFTFMTRAVILAEEKVSEEDVKNLQKGMKNALVQYRNNKGRMVDKRVYSVRATARGKKITAEIKLDGGLPVKRLVSGDEVTPSFADSMNRPLRCERFDIMRVWPRAKSSSRMD